MSNHEQPLEREDLAESGVPTPRFCPRCDRDELYGKPDCPACGEQILEQGYCPVCERFWRQAVGTLCPKHEVELEEGLPHPVFDSPGGETTRWVTVASFSDTTESEAKRLRLEAEGIPTFVEGERIGSAAFYSVATGGMKLQVPESLVNEARVLLSQSWSIPKADDLDDAWEELAPEPGSRRRSVMKGAILLILFGPVIMVLVGFLINMVFGIMPGHEVPAD